jgi:hypothetical protein
LSAAQAARAERAELTGDMVVDELRKIGFANMADYMKSTSSDRRNQVADPGFIHSKRPGLGGQRAAQDRRRQHGRLHEVDPFGEPLPRFFGFDA